MSQGFYPAAQYRRQQPPMMPQYPTQDMNAVPAAPPPQPPQEYYPDAQPQYPAQTAAPQQSGKNRDRVTFHGSPSVTSSVLQRRINAFWVIAYFGYDNIREVTLLRYPSQMLFITEDNEVYDLTVCTTKIDASTAARVRKLYEIKGCEDDVNHIAVVRSEELGKEILPFGFDSYCILDEEKYPRYFA